MPAARPAVFLDRDGVINKTGWRDGVSVPPASLAEFVLLPGVVEAAERLAGGGLPLVVVTNQPDVARGRQARAVVEAMNDRVRELLPVTDVLVCYHDRADGCGCRKPAPGMLLEAAARWQLDLSASVMVGDRWSDVVAGQAAGCRGILIGPGSEIDDRCRPDHRAPDLAAAADWILGDAS